MTEHLVATRRRRLAVGLWVTVLVLGATSARAGITPWGGPVCGDPVAVAAHFFAAFPDSEKCESVCKVSANLCRKAVSSAASCQKQDRSDHWKVFGLVFCTELTGTAKHDCLADFKGALASDKDAIAANQSLGLANCDVYRGECLVACAAP